MMRHPTRMVAIMSTAPIDDDQSAMSATTGRLRRDGGRMRGGCDCIPRG